MTTSSNLRYKQYAKNIKHMKIYLNQTINLLEDSHKTFDENLAKSEKQDSTLFLQGEGEKMAESIADLRRVRDKLGSITWCL